MNRITFFLISCLFVVVTHAQNTTDGLRYAIDDTYGTARFNSLSGAFGALGGDLSAIGINPAGSAVFLSNTMTITFAENDLKSKSTYFNTTTSSSDSDFNLNQGGAVFVFDMYNTDSKWKKFSLGFNYDSNYNYDNQLYIVGNGNTSISEFFLANAQGIPLNQLQLQGNESISDLYTYLGQTMGSNAQNAFLGYQGFIIDPVDPNNPQNSQYISNIAPGTYDQQYFVYESGYRGKYTLNFAAQYSDQFYFGINLNTHIIDYLQSTYLDETNTNSESLVRQVGFENNLYVLGSGFSAQFGTIAKFGENARFGLTYDTPTWYVISEETIQYLESVRIEDGVSLREIINPQVINIYQDYDLRTPGKFLASAAYIFGKNGLLSFDYSYKNYSNIQFSPTNDPYFANENARISNTLRGTSSFRLGGEYRWAQLSFRGGLRYEESPYRDKTTLGDLTGFSVGTGYNFGGFNFDFSYARAEQSRYQQLYDVGLTDSAKVDTTYNNFIFTLGFNM